MHPSRSRVRAMTSFVEVTHDGHVSTLTINRPDKLNALSQEVLSDLSAAVEALTASEDVWAAVITGTGKAFVAGADIAAMKNMTEAEGREFGALGHRVFTAIENLRCPVIAAVNGFALGGGCELALACDFIYASSKAKFGQPEVNLGIVPGFGGTPAAPEAGRLCGRARAHLHGQDAQRPRSASDRIGKRGVRTRRAPRRGEENRGGDRQQRGRWPSLRQSG